jgi:hypothetical protein
MTRTLLAAQLDCWADMLDKAHAVDDHGIGYAMTDAEHAVVNQMRVRAAKLREEAA